MASAHVCVGQYVGADKHAEAMQEIDMQVVNKLRISQRSGTTVPKAKDCYAGKLGLKVAKDSRQDDDHWWVSLDGSEGRATMALTTYKEHMKPGNLTLYFAPSDVTAAHKALADMSVNVGDIQDDFNSPGSGVRFFRATDPDGNLIHVWQS
jgi:predicted enzyme related to lactoylglutathione lyase